MTDGGFRGRVKLGELIDAALAPAEPAAHAGFVADLAAVTCTADMITAVAERFLAEGEKGRSTFLEWVARLRVRLPEAVLGRVPLLLATSTLPDDLRIRAAARALRSSPDQPAFLTQLVPHLTTGLSPLEALARLHALQGRVRRSRALDRLIGRRERRLRLTCPHCPVRLRRRELAAHLYEAHGLILDAGRARRPDRVAKELRKRYTRGRDTTILDQAAQLADPPALRAWAARTGVTTADVAPLAAEAAARGKGLCPRCLAELRPAFGPLPPPLTLTDSLLAGEGYRVEAHGPEAVRTYSVIGPAGLIRSGLVSTMAINPRAAGTLAAGALLTAAIGIGSTGPVAVAIAALGYVAVRLLRPPLPPGAERVVDRAWADLVPVLPSTPEGRRLLTRLCRASYRRADPNVRASTLSRVAEQGTCPYLTAAARFLQVTDAGRLGADPVSGIADLIAAGLSNDEAVAHAEHVAELFLSTDPTPTAAERARLRVLVLEAAFAAGWTPRGLADLWAACPRLRELMAVTPLSRLGLQYVVRVVAGERPWESVPGVGTVFEMARVAPRLGGRLLATYPDLLLYYRPPPVVDEALGWVFVCSRGLVIGGKVFSDPDAEVKVEGGRLIGAATLVLGTTRFTLPRRPPPEFVVTLHRLLRLRTDFFLPRLDAALAAGPIPTTLLPLVRRCGCGADLLLAPGEVGRLVRRGL